MGMQRGSHSKRSWAAWLGAAILATVAVFGLQTEAQAQATFASQDDAAPVTYAADVAEIINQNCVNCHREGGVGPMELTNYEQVSQWAPMVRMMVETRKMPPYAYDTDIGVQELKHDWRLSQEEINTVVSWVDQGAPLGDPDELPPAPELTDANEWNFLAEFNRPPDVVVPSTPIDVPAGGNDMWHRPYVPTGIDTDRCIAAVQVRPVGGESKTVVHHANSTFQEQQPDGSFEQVARVTEYAMGKVGERVPDGVCRIAPEDAWVLWDIHLYPGGLGKSAPGDVVEDVTVEIGIWLHPEDYEAEYEQDLALYGVDEGELVMPPHGTAMTQGFHTFDHPVRIDSFQPHGHLRMNAASLEIYYPETGRTEVISMISDWSAQWHHSHIYEEDAAPVIPAGAVLVLKQWYDNTAENPNNPDPDQWVSAGSRTADEMDHAWIAVTHLDEEGYQEIIEEREAEEEEDDRIARN